MKNKTLKEVYELYSKESSKKTILDNLLMAALDFIKEQCELSLMKANGIKIDMSSYYLAKKKFSQKKNILKQLCASNNFNGDFTEYDVLRLVL